MSPTALSTPVKNTEAAHFRDTESVGTSLQSSGSSSSSNNSSNNSSEEMHSPAVSVSSSRSPARASADDNAIEVSSIIMIIYIC